MKVSDLVIYERNKKELGILGDIIDSVRKLQSELYDKMVYIRKLELEIEVLKANQKET